MNAKFVELHLIQSFPPSCVNRDGNNSPKDCTFGGFRRARISSQCLKRAIRQDDNFTEILGSEIATRSKQMRDKKLIPYLVEQGLSKEKATTAADEFRTELAKNDKKTELTSVGLYFGDEELFALLDAHRAGQKDWKKAAPQKSADVALFGRMLAEAADLNVDAAAQVAHAISTHRLNQETDYWTAADDLKGVNADDEDAGASMLGTAEFNASMFYRYACVSLNILKDNLADDELIKKTIHAFLHASFTAIPTGKLNGHAHGTAPVAAIAVVRRKGAPLNLCNAFVQPVKATDKTGLDVASLQALTGHLERTLASGLPEDADYFLSHSLNVEVCGPAELKKSYGDVIESVLEKI